MVKQEQKVFRQSRQRSRILDVLRSTDTHPTADWLYQELKDEFPNLSLGTVYRNLATLIEQGFVKKIHFGSTFDRFEANTEPHYHFICEECHRIIDLPIPVDDELNERVRKATPFHATRHQIEFFGVCDQCRQSKN